MTVDFVAKPLDKKTDSAVQHEGSWKMLRKTVTAITAVALAGASVVAHAAPQPAPRLDSSIQGDNEDLTTTHWVLIFIGAGLLIWGIIELTDDNEPESP